MKQRLTGILLILTICVPAFTQPYDKAVITDLRYYLAVNYDAGINTSTFPFYFSSEMFTKKIQQVIEETLAGKYDIHQVEYLHGEKVDYREGVQLEGLHLKNEVDRSQKSTLYVAVVTTLYHSMIINSYPRYMMMTKIKIVNHKKRKVYKFKCRQPFEIVQGEAITGAVMLGELDFQDMYLHVMETSIKGELPLLGTKTFEKPATLKYQEFLTNSSRFMQIEEDTIISFVDEMNEGFDAINYKGDFWRSFDNHTNIATPESGQLLWQNRVKRTYDLKNLILDEEYRVKIKGGDTEWLNFLTIHEDVKVIFKTDTIDAGQFTYQPHGLLQGTFYEEKCGVEWIYENEIAEVFMGDRLIGLIHPLPGKKYIYFPDDLSDEEVGILINLVFAYDFAVFVQDIIDANR